MSSTALEGLAGLGSSLAGLSAAVSSPAGSDGLGASSVTSFVISAAGEGEAGLANTDSWAVGAAVDPPVFLRFAWALERADDGYTHIKNIKIFGAK